MILFEAYKKAKSFKTPFGHFSKMRFKFSANYFQMTSEKFGNRPEFGKREEPGELKGPLTTQTKQ